MNQPGEHYAMFLGDKMSDNPIKRYSEAHPENVVWTPETGWVESFDMVTGEQIKYGEQV